MQQLIETIPKIMNNTLFLVFALLNIADYMTGWGKAIVAKKINSTIDTAGNIKRAAMLLMVMLTFSFTFRDDAAQLYYLITGSFSITLALSLVENLAALGVPLPEQITKYIDDKKKEL